MHQLPLRLWERLLLKVNLAEQCCGENLARGRESERLGRDRRHPQAKAFRAAELTDRTSETATKRQLIRQKRNGLGVLYS